MNSHWQPYLLGCILMVTLTLATNPLPRWIFKGESASRDGVLNYDTLLLSKDRGTLYVGAQDTIMAFDISNTNSIQFKAEIQWSPTTSKKEECALKGKSTETECFNFIRVLVQLNETHLYTCGTYAFSPTCAYIDLKDFTLAKKENGEFLLEKGKGVCPYHPAYQNTAILVDGELYTGTMNDFLGNEPIISRTLGSRTALRTEDYPNWFEEDAKFVSSFHTPEDDKVYFFFEETAKGFDVIDKYTVSRVARVCKNDIGGDKILQKKWTTFLKADLSCIHPGQFAYNMVIQHIFALPQPDGGVFFYGVFASQWKVSFFGTSAVCVFTLDAIKKAFDGRYKELNRINSQWTTYYGQTMDPRPGSCSVGPSSDKAIDFMKDHYLMAEKVAPINKKPLHIMYNGKYTRIAVHQTQNVLGVPYIVMFLLTDQGHLHKVVVVGMETHFIEEIVLFQNTGAIRDFLLAPEKGILYVGYTNGVLSVPFANCGLHATCTDCVLARDPYCAWDGDKCRNLREGGENIKTWVQDIETKNPDPGCQQKNRMAWSALRSRNNS